MPLQPLFRLLHRKFVHDGHGPLQGGNEFLKGLDRLPGPTGQSDVLFRLLGPFLRGLQQKLQILFGFGHIDGLNRPAPQGDFARYLGNL